LLRLIRGSDPAEQFSDLISFLDRHFATQEGFVARRGYALSLTVAERAKYTAISQEITDLRRELETGSRRGLALIRWCRSASGAKNPKARRLIGLISDRKRLLYSSEQRFKAVDRLVQRALFSIDTTGTIFNAERKPIELAPDLIRRLAEFEVGGRFLVTPKRFHLVKLMGQADALYLGQLRELPRAKTSSAPPTLDNLRLGSEYPVSLAHGKTFSVLQRDGRLIAKKERSRVTFVRSLDREPDPTKRSRLEDIQKALRGVYQGGRQISKIFVNDLGHVGYLYQGRAYFVGVAPEGNAGFIFDD
jgi:hypothetical protein